MSYKSGNEGWSNISESDLMQNFPLHRACRDGDVSLLTNLLQQKDSANLHLCLEDTYYGWTPLHWAAYFGKPECLRALAQASGPGTVDLKTSRYNQTPAHIAAFAGHPLCLQWLIQLGSTINAKDYLGETPLHKAARSGSEQCVSLLVNNKALIGVRNESGKTPAELASLGDHVSIRNYLENLQKQEAPILPLVSSNGYYGYQPISGSPQRTKTACECDASMEMDTEDSPSPIPNGTNGIPNGTNGIPNGINGIPNGINGITNGHAFTNGSSITNAISPPVAAAFNGHTNGFHPGANGMRNGVVSVERLRTDLKGDITLSEDVSRNRIPIAGKKRSREEAVIVPQVKRIRTEDTLHEAVELIPETMLSVSRPSTHDPVSVDQGDPDKGDRTPRGPSLLCACKVRQQQEMIWVI